MSAAFAGLRRSPPLPAELCQFTHRKGVCIYDSERPDKFATVVHKMFFFATKNLFLNRSFENFNCYGRSSTSTRWPLLGVSFFLFFFLSFFLSFSFLSFPFLSFSFLFFSFRFFSFLFFPFIFCSFLFFSFLFFSFHFCSVPFCSFLSFVCFFLSEGETYK